MHPKTHWDHAPNIFFLEDLFLYYVTFNTKIEKRKRNCKQNKKKKKLDF